MPDTKVRFNSPLVSCDVCGTVRREGYFNCSVCRHAPAYDVLVIGADGKEVYLRNDVPVNRDGGRA